MVIELSKYMLVRTNIANFNWELFLVGVALVLKVKDTDNKQTRWK